MIGTLSTCPNGHSFQWESQQCHYGMPWSSILVASAIVFSGSNVSKSLCLFRHLKLTMMSTSTFNWIQSAYVISASPFTWDFQQEELLRNSEGRVLTLGGDARCDSPGFSAKFGSYTLMDLETGKSNEVPGSTHMELEGLKRSLLRLCNAGLHVQTLVTDRYGMMKKYMRTEHPDKNHFFDVWHMAKEVSKKLEAAVKKRDCQNIRPWVKSAVNHCYWVAVSSGENGELKEQKWASLTQHIANKHESCEHGVLAEDKLWLKEGSRAHKLFREVVESKFLLKDIGKLSPLHQTYGLEVYHSVVNSFAPKNTHFFYPAIMAR
ncbi:uncharacterized protein LOC134261454 [Saccostrea cucullata]|uniref:uncharacterized protein LOC134261454 n=1 Tax=Saccostrea cuccullata TaxID=36930 RepID=UPI002ED6B3D3